ncbi:MAG: fluoride efflux transporter CrcB [Bacillota bacterium]
MLISLTYICAGGFLGAAARYILGRCVGRVWRGSFPLGTFTVNMVGSFLLGLLAFHPALSGSLGKDATLGISVGFLGSFTTFSTLEYETMQLLEKGKATVAAAYVTASFVAGFAAAWVARALFM